MSKSLPASLCFSFYKNQDVRLMMMGGKRGDTGTISAQIYHKQIQPWKRTGGGGGNGMALNVLHSTLTSAKPSPALTYTNSRRRVSNYLPTFHYHPQHKWGSNGFCHSFTRVAALALERREREREKKSSGKCSDQAVPGVVVMAREKFSLFCQPETGN